MAIPVAIAKLTNGTQDESILQSAISSGSISRTISAADSTFSSPASSISSYQYVLLEKPTGSNAVLSSATSETCTLTNIDTIGTYRVLLIVTDDQSQSSQNDILKAPDTAFVQVHVKTEYLDVVKPATGERNWTSYYHDFVDAVDTMKNTVDNISVAAATTTSLGTVKLAEAALDNANPKVSTVQRRTLTAFVNGQTINREFSPYLSQTATSSGAVLPSMTGNQSAAIVAWRPGDFGVAGAADVKVTGFTATMLDGGAGNAGTDFYRFTFYTCTKTEFTSNSIASWTNIGNIKLPTQESTGGSAGAPTQGGIKLAAPAPVANGKLIVVAITGAPSITGTGLTLTVELEARH